jgi:enoyl-CoA hydratase/carnithine racemase
MDQPSNPSLAVALPPSLTARLEDDVAFLRLARPAKRNALDDETILGFEAFFESLPEPVKAVVLHGEGDHFSAGLDLAELTERDVVEGVAH